MSHTPGPWRCIGGPFPGVLEIESVRGEYVAADVHGEANANLITAAPDLLAALKALREADRNSDQSAVCNQADAAIAKAEGSSS